MKVINNGVMKEYKLITSFKFDGDDKEYIIFTNTENEGEEVYLANLSYEEDKINILAPNKDRIYDVKKIIENLISNNPNVFVLSQSKYHYLDINLIKDKEFNEVQKQKIQLNSNQYVNLCNNKYLRYPFNNLTSKTVNKEYSKNTKIYTIISSIILVLLFGGFIAYSENLFNSLFNLDTIGILITTFQFDYISSLYGITPVVLLQLGLITLLVSLLAYYYEESKIIVSYILSYIALFIISIGYYMHMKMIDLSHLNDYMPIIKGTALFCLVHTLIFVITYHACKGVTYIITEKLKVRNFIVHSAIFVILFLVGIIGVTLFYDYNLYEHVAEFVSKTVYGG